ncbi:MAG: hypothetical protein JOZ07_15080 [Solirubrobacterales bacterium]|nr:hypothetical protein [Solirubrobacterales bacterium]
MAVPRLPSPIVALLLASLLAAPTLAILPAGARARTDQAQIIEEDPALLAHPGTTLAQMRALGASTIRVVLHWDLVAPQDGAKHAPARFDDADPADYPAAHWAPYDAVVRDAQADGLTIDLTIAGGAPVWAQGAGIPPQGRADRSFAWKPNPRLYGDFVHAVAERYSGRYVPSRGAPPLPRVHWWTLWNEPNFGQDLGPQAIDGSTVSVAPMMYRGLVDAGWRALHQTGHGGDTIVIGGFAAMGLTGRVDRAHPLGLPGDYAQTKPRQFVRTLYCLDVNSHPLRAAAAAAVGCPTTAAGTRAFRTAHPGLFGASGVADHPYSGERSPIDASDLDGDFALFSQLGGFEHTLDLAQRVYGSRRRYPIYDDEYGYITRPPHPGPYLSPTTAALYLNWSEYLSWRSARVASYAQYLLTDPPPGRHVGFASGLETLQGRPKATLYAYRLPLFLPQTTVAAGRSAEVWGNARPAPFMARDADGPQRVRIGFQAGGRGPFRTLQTVTVGARDGYFDLRLRFPASGNVRLTYQYPRRDPFLATSLEGETIHSRVVKLTVL